MEEEAAVRFLPGIAKCELGGGGEQRVVVKRERGKLRESSSGKWITQLTGEESYRLTGRRARFEGLPRESLKRERA